MRESPLRQANLRLVIISNIRLSNSAFHPARDHGKPIAQIISNNNRNLLLQPSAASDRGIEKIVADIIGFCLIRQSFTVPIVCFHSKSI